MRLPRTARQTQSGATLVELLVSVVIIGLAMALIVGTISSGLLQAVIADRNTSATGAAQYEMNAVGARQFDGAAQGYSDCFTNAAGTSPVTTPVFAGACPDPTFTVRADVTVTNGLNGSQQWTVSVVSWPAQTPLGQPVSFLKVNR